MQKQRWVIASQKRSETSSATVYFAALPPDTKWLEIGDAPAEWNGRNPPLPEPTTPLDKNSSDHHSDSLGYTVRERLELPRDELLQRQIDKTKQNLHDLEWELDNPKEAAAQELAKQEARKAARNVVQYEWYEFMNAINGGWLKACTRPPSGDDTIKVLHVRDGRVIDLVTTTVKRYCQWQTPEYRGGCRGGAASWGIELNLCSGARNVFKESTQVGDCVMLQIASKNPSLSKIGSPTNMAKFQSTDETTPTALGDHAGFVDLELVASQRKVVALQMTQPKHFNAVYFDCLAESSHAFKVGDKIWPANPVPDASRWIGQEESFRKAGRDRLTKTKHEQLKDKIGTLEKTLKDLTEIRDNPEKREELFEEIRAKNPVQWNEAAVAIGGAWIKASTRPPSGKTPVSLVLVRDGSVVEILSTTISKLSRAYRATGEFAPSVLSSRQGQPWGIGIDLFAIRDAFDTEIQVGDCALLKVDPRLCENAQVVY